MKHILLCILILTIAIPSTIYAKGTGHIEITLDQSCSECHSKEADVWENSKHGLMGVECVVCHGDPGKNFVARPGSDRCVGCHSEQVAGRAEGHQMKKINCWACHDRHSLMTKSGT